MAGAVDWVLVEASGVRLSTCVLDVDETETSSMAARSTLTSALYRYLGMKTVQRAPFRSLTPGSDRHADAPSESHDPGETVRG